MSTQLRKDIKTARKVAHSNNLEVEEKWVERQEKKKGSILVIKG